MRISTCLFLFVIGPLCAATESLPAGGSDLVTTQGKLSGWAGQGGSVSKVPVTGQDFPEAMRVTVVTADPEKPWSAQLTTPFTAGSVKNGDKLLVVYMARCVAGGTGRAIAKVQVAEPTSPMVGMTGTAKIGPAWSQINQAFEAKAAAPEGKGELVIFLGEQAQTVEIAEVRVLNYGPDMDLAKLPQPKETYAGREPDAPWRKAALERIEQIRKADMTVQLTDADGKPLANPTSAVRFENRLILPF